MELLGIKIILNCGIIEKNLSYTKTILVAIILKPVGVCKCDKRLGGSQQTERFLVEADCAIEGYELSEKGNLFECNELHTKRATNLSRSESIIALGAVLGALLGVPMWNLLETLGL